MTSCDTNVLFAACDTDSPHHIAARAFLRDHALDPGFFLGEQVLLELYCLLRNPKVCAPPLGAVEAVATIERLRRNPRWRVVDIAPGHRIMDRVWQHAVNDELAYRRVFDLRLAFTLQHHGVTDFATRNLRDFADVGFARVWDPTAASTR